MFYGVLFVDIGAVLNCRKVSFISLQVWYTVPDRDLVDVQTAVNPVGSTTTSAGLKAICKADHNDYPLSKKVSDEDYHSIPIDKINPFGYWNYIID